MQESFNTDLIHFVMTAVFSFLIGLEIKSYRARFHKEDTKTTIGSARTYTLIGILGYLLFILDTSHTLYLAGFIGFTILFSLFYWQQLQQNRTSILLYLVGLIVYSFGPLIAHYPVWFVSLLFVMTIFILNSKVRLQYLMQHINTTEFETLGKMVLLSAVILPLLSRKPLEGFVSVSPFEIWFAVVVISGISYGGYIFSHYFFKNKGYLLTGIIGGIYSSTAATVVLARKIKEHGSLPVLTAAIIGASSMMYLRLIVVASFFNLAVAKTLAVPFLIFFVLALLVAFFYAKNPAPIQGEVKMSDENPLELGTAFIFGVLFVAMMAITQYVTSHYGKSGLELLSFLIGFTDIDPFVLSILRGHENITNLQIVTAIMISAGSNNLLKAIYTMWFGNLRGGIHAAIWLSIFGATTIGYAFLLS